MRGPRRHPAQVRPQARQLAAEFRVASSFMWLVRGSDNVDQAQCGEGAARAADREHQARHDDPRFGPPPATAAQAPHLSGFACEKALR